MYNSIKHTVQVSVRPEEAYCTPPRVSDPTYSDRNHYFMNDPEAFSLHLLRKFDVSFGTTIILLFSAAYVVYGGTTVFASPRTTRIHTYT